MVAQEDHGRPDVDRPSKANASAVEDVVWMVYKVGLMSSRCQGCLGMAGRATTEWFLVLLPSIPVHSIHRSKDVKWIKMDSLFWAIKAEHAILGFRNGSDASTPWVWISQGMSQAVFKVEKPLFQANLISP